MSNFLVFFDENENFVFKTALINGNSAPSLICIIYLFLKQYRCIIYKEKFEFNFDQYHFLRGGNKLNFWFFWVFVEKYKTELQPIIFSQNELKIEDLYFSNFLISGKNLEK